MKTLISSASLAAMVLVSSAIAQTPAPAERMAPPSAPPTSAQPEKATPITPATTHSDWRASKLIGAAVYNGSNERIGDVNELLLDNSGKVARVVLGVGGFLGMGEHEVAVPFNELRISQEGSSIKIGTTYTKQSLSSMPQWKWNSAEKAKAL